MKKLCLAICNYNGEFCNKGKDDQTASRQIC